jgi:mRNA interferase MazF
MNINQGEIWLVNFDPSIGNEIQKLRPALVINDDIMGRFGLRIIVPITGWKDYYEEYPWIIKIENNNTNGLSKLSGLECFQVKSFSQDRFNKKLGIIPQNLLYKIHQTVLKTLNPLYEIHI